jgi:hypothetical protein
MLYEPRQLWVGLVRLWHIAMPLNLLERLEARVPA